jgi:hypothetical protein
MNYQTIEEIYNGNERIRVRLRELLSALTPEQTSTLPADEKWTIAEIVEHISIVDEGALRICSKLLREAQGANQTSDGSATISAAFLDEASKSVGVKLEAPDRVKPSGEKSIEDSLAKLDATSELAREMRTLFETVGGTDPKFPHPYFGDLSAQEWLALKGGHEMRHIKQIEKVLSKIG